WAKGNEFLVKTTFGTFQYVFIKWFCALIMLILSICGVYTPGRLELTDGYPYVVFIYSLSQMWAMYCLVLFYTHFKEKLKEIKPFAKLLCIKCVVFLTFWQ